MPSIKANVNARDSISLDDVCFLLTPTYIRDELLQEKEILVPEMVYCSPFSVGQKEFSITMQVGLKADITLLINYDEYDNQEEVEYNRKRYKIYRTFVRSDGYIELYCEGISHGDN